ncbi:hypothetical protein SAMD00019534_115850 [Acytostelium subglobosum LB1]|uniref:hypothetical protein n=1 Tax=Acytostelium subglobosum LB1 TaxID=1410327 RepID=UPI000644D982|nr:hypothetical protein SAMD00019534_115850 [Acytostelium subglobosum LB1]GAM28409.1 hypothetical protein SAMD00019534_115850 [Acytostelium subglobosum LB1]|eukprot:XP_012748726.1 hypothetical protein SAMD00019534_115850 [Acytostelium subglobosum LB1]
MSRKPLTTQLSFKGMPQPAPLPPPLQIPTATASAPIPIATPTTPPPTITPRTIATSSSSINTHNKQAPPLPPPRDAKANVKSAVISTKLKKFFTNRPSRDSLYQRHILSAPYNSSNLSYYNVFKIIGALKNANVVNTEGIFRINGNAETIRTLWISLNTAELNLEIPHTHHDLAGLLKLYLRETKFPLVPIELLPNKTTPTRVDGIKELVGKLPDDNIRVLAYLIGYLEQLTQNSQVNKMNSVALGVCFAPNIIRSISTNSSNTVNIAPDSLNQIQNYCNLITTIIDNRESIFRPYDSIINGSEQLDKIDTAVYSSSPCDEYINEIPPPPPLPIFDSTGSLSPISPLYDELTNELIECVTCGKKDIIVGRLTNLFVSDPDNLKLFLKDMGVDCLVSLLEVILT